MTSLTDFLIVDDDPVFGQVLSRQLERRGHRCAHCTSLSEALAVCGELQPSAIVLDLKLGVDNGLQAIVPLQRAAPSARIVLASGYASIATTVEAMRLGAHNCLPKPFSLADLLTAFQDPRSRPPPGPPEEPHSLRRREWEHIQRVLADCGGNVSAAARQLGLDRRTLQRRLAKRPVAEQPRLEG